MEKLKVAQAIVVEGKYDKIKLSAVVDGVIICTNGFGIYKDKTTAELIRFYAQSSGIIILTDSDSAGFQIRNHLKGLIQGGKITNLYIPEIFGKEKRKTLPSKEGKLGVEGIDADILRDVFERSGVLAEQAPRGKKLTKSDLYDLGLSGRPNSSFLRKELCKKLGLPCSLSTNALIDHLELLGESVDLSELVDKINAESSCN